MWWHSPEQERKETGRLEALSDGVFAIAVTLLVLGIPIPTQDTLGTGSLLTYLFSHNHWVSFVTYAVSFVTILVMWINHHSMFQFVARIDRPFVVANGLLLMMVTFVNYPTALVANFASTSNATFAAAMYSAVLVAISLLYITMWFRIAGNHGLMVSDADPDEVASISRQYRFGWLFYLFAFALAFPAPWLSIALNGALALYFAFTGRITRAIRRREPAPHSVHPFERSDEQQA